MVFLLEWLVLARLESSADRSTRVLNVLCRCGTKILVLGEPGILPTLRAGRAELDELRVLIADVFELPIAAINNLRVFGAELEDVDVVAFNLPPLYSESAARGGRRFVEKELKWLSAHTCSIIDSIDDRRQSERRKYKGARGD